MPAINNLHKFMIGFALLAALSLAGCKSLPAQYGTLEGKVSIGPLCPVERNPPDPSCLPTADTYAARPIEVFTPGYKAMVAKLSPVPPDGAYTLNLPAGNYIVDLKIRNPSGIGSANLPADITLSPDKTTTLDITIDTGIR
jgi:hypothetical protein